MRALLWLAMGLTACESIEPSGAVFEPVVESAPEPAPVPEAVVAPVEPGGFDFDADARVGPHPLNLLAEHREAVQVAAIEVEIDGDDVGLIVADAGQPSEAGIFQDLFAFSP